MNILTTTRQKLDGPKPLSNLTIRLVLEEREMLLILNCAADWFFYHSIAFLLLFSAAVLSFKERAALWVSTDEKVGYFYSFQ